MTRIGCSGHQTLAPATRRVVAAEITTALKSSGDELVGLSSLAVGADQVFAYAILSAGAELHAVIPSEGYEVIFTTDEAAKSYKALLSLAAHSTTLNFPVPSEDAYLAAGRYIVDHCDVLLAVWDGQAAAGKGGTADVVNYARERGVDARVIWPPGAQRS